MTRWRKGWDSNPRYPCGHAGFQDRCLKPLGHPSVFDVVLLFRSSQECTATVLPHCYQRHRTCLWPRVGPRQPSRPPRLLRLWRRAVAASASVTFLRKALRSNICCLRESTTKTSSYGHLATAARGGFPIRIPFFLRASRRGRVMAICDKLVIRLRNKGVHQTCRAFDGTRPEPRAASTF